LFGRVDAAASDAGVIGKSGRDKDSCKRSSSSFEREEKNGTYDDGGWQRKGERGVIGKKSTEDGDRKRKKEGGQS